MPIHLPAISRRKFLAGSLATGIALATRGSLFAADAKRAVDPHRIAFLSDTHIHADPARIAREINMADHLRQTCSEVLKNDALPSRVVINGDFAFSAGESADYVTAVDLLKPIRTAGIPIHVTLGNHDHRENFLAGVPDARQPVDPVKEKYVALIELERASLLLLDSLQIVNQTPGEIGAHQLAWLAKTLDAHTTKPAIVIVHHNPNLEGIKNPAGLLDTAALFETLTKRKQAKALVYGHSHRWSHTERPDGLHLINLPATAYAFAKEQPLAWVDAKLGQSDAELKLMCLDPEHPGHEQSVKLKWRMA